MTDEPSGDGDYIEAKKHALWYGGLEKIQTVTSLTQTRLPFRLKIITTQSDPPTPDFQKKTPPTKKSAVKTFAVKPGQHHECIENLRESESPTGLGGETRILHEDTSGKSERRGRCESPRSAKLEKVDPAAPHVASGWHD